MVSLDLIQDGPRRSGRWVETANLDDGNLCRDRRNDDRIAGRPRGGGSDSRRFRRMAGLAEGTGFLKLRGRPEPQIGSRGPPLKRAAANGVRSVVNPGRPYRAKNLRSSIGHYPAGSESKPLANGGGRITPTMPRRHQRDHRPRCAGNPTGCQSSHAHEGDAARDGDGEKGDGGHLSHEQH